MSVRDGLVCVAMDNRSRLWLAGRALRVRELVRRLVGEESEVVARWELGDEELEHLGAARAKHGFAWRRL
eukprot:6189323-Pleurochrysis_carterae.AAC.2